MKQKKKIIKKKKIFLKNHPNVMKIVFLGQKATHLSKKIEGKKKFFKKKRFLKISPKYYENRLFGTKRNTTV